MRSSSASSTSKAQGRDLKTRERVIEEAALLFADRGFSKVTIRDICRRARANVAAVNYHFGGKAGLYEEVLERTIRVMEGTTEAVRKAGEGRGPEEQLAAYVTVFVQRVFESRDSWIHQLMMRELSDPTPALDVIVDRVIRPRMDYLSGVVAALIGCPIRDPRVRQCVLSVHCQCLAVRENPVAPRLGFERMTQARVRAMAGHIARFSLAGILAVAAGQRARPRG